MVVVPGVEGLRNFFGRGPHNLSSPVVIAEQNSNAAQEVLPNINTRSYFVDTEGNPLEMTVAKRIEVLAQNTLGQENFSRGLDSDGVLDIFMIDLAYAQTGLLVGRQQRERYDGLASEARIAKWAFEVTSFRGDGSRVKLRYFSPVSTDLFPKKGTEISVMGECYVSLTNPPDGKNESDELKVAVVLYGGKYRLVIDAGNGYTITSKEKNGDKKTKILTGIFDKWFQLADGDPSEFLLSKKIGGF